ncbi:hypothetical protein NDU88_009171 [Pleurodeles waltl]|uniref:Uncharacterized protein n=1 Tax=Pleurodeles waltl TaxID=8319 RepID=A0AAV7NY93_PLEWA|nr:hypothetical protein NDU88_009171 [Pleurodeles waltl]
MAGAPAASAVGELSEGTRKTSLRQAQHGHLGPASGSLVVTEGPPGLPNPRWRPWLASSPGAVRVANHKVAARAGRSCRAVTGRHHFRRSPERETAAGTGDTGRARPGVAAAGLRPAQRERGPRPRGAAGGR